MGDGMTSAYNSETNILHDPIGVDGYVEPSIVRTFFAYARCSCGDSFEGTGNTREAARLDAVDKRRVHFEREAK